MSRGGRGKGENRVSSPSLLLSGIVGLVVANYVVDELLERSVARKEGYFWQELLLRVFWLGLGFLLGFGLSKLF